MEDMYRTETRTLDHVASGDILVGTSKFPTFFLKSQYFGFFDERKRPYVANGIGIIVALVKLYRMVPGWPLWDYANQGYGRFSVQKYFFENFRPSDPFFDQKEASLCGKWYWHL